MTSLLSTAQLRVYLTRHGWEEASHGNQGWSFVLPGRPDAPAILVPDDPRDRDWGHLMDSALARASRAMGTPEETIVDEAMASADVLQLRLEDAETSSGRIPLDWGAEVVDSFRQLIYVGARFEFLGARVSYSGGLSDEARAVVNRLELAPPSAGSFKLEVFAGPDPQIAFDVGDQPRDPAKATLVSTLKAIGAAKDIAETASGDDDLDLEAAISRGVSRNLLNAMVRLSEHSPRLRVEFRGLWGEWEADDPEDAVVVESAHFERFAQIRDVLAEREPREDFPLFGWIKAVEADELAADELPLTGVVVVEARVEGSLREVRVDLQGPELREAAGGLGEQFFTALGRLEKIRQSWVLVEPRGVRITDRRPAYLDE